MSNDGVTVAREVAEMRRKADGWRSPNFAQVEGPNDLKIYGGAIADDLDRWADMLEAAARHRLATEASVEGLVEALRFYAEPHEHPNEGPWGINSLDFGRRAREALAAYEASK